MPAHKSPARRAASRVRRIARSCATAARTLARRAYYAGTRRQCPVCGHSARQFLAYGVVSRDDARCPSCGSLERHRFAWLYLVQRTNLFDARPKRVLHIAPEPCFARRFAQRIGSGYVTADLDSGVVAESIDLEHIPHRDDSFDVVYCSHVLEHVTDDRRAMAEMRRVLKRDGWAMILVPITADHTIEDPSITDPRERERVFGQHDHVRRYGPDFVERLEQAGLGVTVATVSQLVGAGDAVRMGLTAGAGEIYHCRRA
ncbi:MAG TPA: class I SAM-dependent methyltransferase [Gemmatimonadaceae bacterium]|nr:class I SAM-dependent methyltransferase [Gemmatimonadaceae bacterium]